MPDGTTRPRRGKLLAVAPETVEPKKPKVLIYGPPGVGKTWASLDFPSVYYIDTEGGADLDHYRAKLRDSGGAYLGPDQGSLDFDVVISQIQALATEQHHFRTVVLDSASKLWNMALLDEQEKSGEKNDYGAYKRLPTRKFMSMIKWLQRLDMNAIIICQQKELWGLNEKKQREMIGYTFDCQEKLNYDLHLELRISKIGSGDYAKWFMHVGKSRLTAFKEGARHEWSYESFAALYGQDVIEKEVQPLQLATEEQLAEMERLLGIVKMPEDWESKIFKAAKAESWEEVDSDKMDACIKLLKDKLS